MSTTALRALSTPLRFRLYPTGEFSATKIKETGSLMPPVPSETLEEALQWSASSYAKGQVSDELRADLVRSSLGSSNVPNSHKPSKARGRKGMTRYNKRLIVNSALLLERKYATKTLSFLTLTLPGECASSEPHLYRECKRQMLQWLQRTLARFGLPDTVIGCTEIQTERLNSSGCFALHEHWVFKGRERFGHWQILPKAFQTQWNRILANVYGLGVGSLDLCPSTRVESIKKSSAAYLGKYVSKGEKCIQQLIQDGYEKYLPSSWVTRTLSMLAMFRGSIVTISGDKAREIMETLQDNASIFCRWGRDLRIQLSTGIDCWLGFIGYLSGDGFAYLDSIRVLHPGKPVLGCS